MNLPDCMYDYRYEGETVPYNPEEDELMLSVAQLNRLLAPKQKGVKLVGQETKKEKVK